MYSFENVRYHYNELKKDRVGDPTAEEIYKAITADEITEEQE